MPERVNVKGMNVTLPVDAGNLEKVFSVTGVNAELNLGRPGMVDIVKADAVVQGIRVTAQGAFPIGQDDSGDFTLTAQDMAAVREQLNQVLNYMDRVKWPDASPPRLIVNLSDDPKGGVRIGMDLQAPFLRYGKSWSGISCSMGITQIPLSWPNALPCGMRKRPVSSAFPFRPI